VLLSLWMAAQGAGLVPPRNVVVSMRRLRVTCAHNERSCSLHPALRRCGEQGSENLEGRTAVYIICSYKAVLG